MRQISGAVTMSPGNTVQAVVKSLQDACVQQPSHVTGHAAAHEHTRVHSQGLMQRPEDVHQDVLERVKQA